jgi:glycosyltransferase involved in cell wall biosynthesis
MAELPVACSDFPFLRKVVTNGGETLGTLFDPAHPEDIAHAINRIVTDRDHYDRIKHNLREAKKVYNWENEVKKLIRVYKEIES